MKIVTVHVCPPIPIRGFDWCAYDFDTYDEEGDPLYGWGPTEEWAINDLKAQLEELNNDGA